jgi:hypothetical protein
MRTFARALVPALLVVLALAHGVEAVTTYSYVGDHFAAAVSCCGPTVFGVYTTGDRITGSFTVADGFIPGEQRPGGAGAEQLQARCQHRLQWKSCGNLFTV